MTRQIVIAALCIAGLMCNYSCKKGEPRSVSFYHWKTDYSMDNAEREILEKAHSETLYLRFFDVIYNHREERVLPTATLQVDSIKPTLSVRLVPVVYITNEVFQKVKDPREIEMIADEILKKIYRIKKNHFPNVTLTEIQIDCDWTVGTREAFFGFLTNLQESEILEEYKGGPIQLSATIRLHQVKFPEKTGIPPVDRGTIMFYNVGDLQSLEETNSILNIEKIDSYLGRLKDYPLDYNVALPIFGWGVLYRDDRLIGIITDIDGDHLVKNFEATQDKTWYIAKSDAYIGGNFVYKGDRLRMENVFIEDLKTIHTAIQKAAKREYSVVLYHINSKTLHQTDINELLEALR